MAESTPQLNREAFVCSICLDFLKVPVTIPCGHSYCMSCVNTHWDERKTMGYGCPQCTQFFSRRPVLVKNTMLSVLMDGLKKTGLTAPAAHLYAALGDVSCDLCCGMKMKAVKSCLQCLVSYCEEHLQPHHDVAALKRHKLVEPTENLQDNMCSQHDEVIKMFCRTDQKCICYLCSVDQHKGHDVVTAVEERTERQKELHNSKQEILQKIHVKEKDVSELQQKVESVSDSIDPATQHKITCFKEFIPSIEQRMSEARQQIRSQQEEQESKVKKLQDKLQNEISELQGRLTQLETLSHTDDHCQFLQNFVSLTKLDKDSDLPTINRAPFFPLVTAAVSELQVQIHNIDIQDMKMSEESLALEEMRRAKSAASKVTTKAPLPRGVPVPMKGLRQYACDVTLDPNTAHGFLALSAGNKKVTHLPKMQKYRKHPERFTHVHQVLSKEPLPTRCYIEVAFVFDKDYTDGTITLAVTYKDIQRKGPGREAAFGRNLNSWGFAFGDNDVHFFLHNQHSTEVWSTLCGDYKVGMFVDQEAGTLAFYRLDRREWIHEVETGFIEPLYLGIGFTKGLHSAKICQLK